MIFAPGGQQGWGCGRDFGGCIFLCDRNIMGTVGFDDHTWFSGAVGVRATHPRVFACSLSLKITGI